MEEENEFQYCENGGKRIVLIKRKKRFYRMETKMLNIIHANAALSIDTIGREDIIKKDAIKINKLREQGLSYTELLKF